MLHTFNQTQITTTMNEKNQVSKQLAYSFTQHTALSKASPFSPAHSNALTPNKQK